MTPTSDLGSPAGTVARLAAAAAVLVGGLVHLQLYFDGYRNIPNANLGRSFVVNGIVSVVIAAALVVRRDVLVRLAAAAVAAGTLVAFALSRSDRGIFGFSERGLEPSPQAALTLIAEILVLVLVAVTFVPAVGAGQHLSPIVAAPAVAAVVLVSIGGAALWARTDAPATTSSRTATTVPADPSSTAPPDTSSSRAPTTVAAGTPSIAPPATEVTTAPDPIGTSPGPIGSPRSADTTLPAGEPDPTTTVGPEQVPPTTTGDGGVNAVTVSIVDFRFDDDQLEVPVGTTVRWVNDDSFAHSVVADDGSFVSDRIEPGESFEFTLGSAGEFAYICGLHPSMSASITVVG